MAGRALSVLAAALALAACATEIPLEDAPAPDALRADGAWIRAPGVTRKDVHARLGAPWISDPAARADVFHLDARQHHLLLFLAPYPIPLPGPSTRFDAFTLVAYDPDGQVLATDATFVASELFDVPMEGAPTHRPFARAGDFMFVHPGLGSEHAALAVTHARYLAEIGKPANACTLLPTCAPMGDGEQDRLCWHRLAVDGRTLGYGVFLSRWTLRDTGAPPVDAAEAAPMCFAGAGLCSHALTLGVPVTLPPGSHRVRFDNRYIGGSVEGTFTCTAGEHWYALLDGHVDARYTMGEQLTHGIDMGHGTGSVRFTRTLPAGSTPLPVLLNVGGEWLDGRAAEAPF